MNIVKVEAYNAWKDKNTDTYGSAIFSFAEEWANEMEHMLAADPTKKVWDVADQASKVVDNRPGFGITGYMYGAAVSILSNHWDRGVDLAKWHNRQYVRDEEDEARADAAAEKGLTVNPAIMTIDVSSKE